MKKKPLIFVGCFAAVFLLLILSSCNMSPADSLFTSFAQGSKIPAEYAIASGNAGLMLGCLAGLEREFNSTGLSGLERGEIALDMVDLLAVLSQSMIVLFSYILEGSPPGDLADIDSFYSSPIDAEYLIRIANEKLMEYGINADPSPMQLFWSILGLAIYENVVNGGDYSTMAADHKLLYDNLVAAAEQK
ncbi:MAG: hypothetical protein KAH21_01165, partial [Spirochaetaceae bacterium]|nr:hypothetical protein [Spirochaetaceae bacterium]